MKILAVDIGNTFTKVALFRGREMVWRTSEATDALSNKRNADALARELQRRAKTADALGVSSVVPNALKRLLASMESGFGEKIIQVSARLRLPFRSRYQTPETLGADRLALLARASEQYENAVIAINFGTAITYDALTSAKEPNERREHLGGLILAGAGLRAAALHERAAQLPSFEFQPMKTPMGTSTKDCLAAGLYFGMMSETDGVIAQLKTRLRKLGEKKIVVIAAGGDAVRIAKAVKAIDAVEPEAVLRGARRLVEIQLTSVQTTRRVSEQRHSKTLFPSSRRGNL